MSRRSSNGQGYTTALSVQFDPNNPDDMRALEVWQFLAEQRKGSLVIKALLHFIADHYDRTGVVLTPDRIVAQFFDGSVVNSGPPIETPVEREIPDVVVRKGGGAASAEDIAAGYLAGAGDLDSIFGN